MAITRLSGGLSPADGSDPRTFPEIFNEAADEIESLPLQIYPVGSIYMSVVNTNPGTLFGGTWEEFGKGRVVVGVDDADADFDTDEKTGGSKEHNHLGSTHIHSSAAHNHTTPNHSHSSASHNHLTPSGWNANTEFQLNTDADLPGFGSETGTGRVNVEAKGGSVSTQAFRLAVTQNRTPGNTGNSSPTTNSTTPGATGQATQNVLFTETLPPFITAYMFKRTA